MPTSQRPEVVICIKATASNTVIHLTNPLKLIRATGDTFASALREQVILSVVKTVFPRFLWMPRLFGRLSEALGKLWATGS